MTDLTDPVAARAGHPRSNQGLTAGIDVGGTKILAVVVDPLAPADLLATAEVPTPSAGGAEALTDAIAAVFRQAASRVEAPPRRVGLGLPGLVDRAGVLRYGPHLPGVLNAAIGAQLGAALPAVVTVGNDGNYAALAEATLGAGRGHEAVLFVGLGTGISCGLVLRGQLLAGSHGFAGEPGHVVVDPAGPLCACGRDGCWETLASGTGLAFLANRHCAATGEGPQRSPARPLRGEDVTRAWLGGQPWAGSVIAEFAHWVARGLAGLVALFDPGVIVLGGSMMELGDRLVAPIRREMAVEVFRPEERGGPPLVAAELGRNAGAIGAAVAAGKLIIPSVTRAQD